MKKMADRLTYFNKVSIITDIKSPIDIKVGLKNENLNWPIYRVNELGYLLNGYTINIPVLMVWDKNQMIIDIFNLDIRTQDRTNKYLLKLNTLFD